MLLMRQEDNKIIMHLREDVAVRKFRANGASAEGGEHATLCDACCRAVAVNNRGSNDKGDFISLRANFSIGRQSLTTE